MHANNLYLFGVRGWRYCAGATIICAPSLKEAIRIGNKLKNSQDETGRDACLIAETDYNDPGFFAEGEGGTGCWTFEMEFVLAKPREVGLVFTDANYA